MSVFNLSATWSAPMGLCHGAEYRGLSLISRLSPTWPIINFICRKLYGHTFSPLWTIFKYPSEEKRDEPLSPPIILCYLDKRLGQVWDLDEEWRLLDLSRDAPRSLCFLFRPLISRWPSTTASDFDQGRHNSLPEWKYWYRWFFFNGAFLNASYFFGRLWLKCWIIINNFDIIII